MTRFIKITILILSIALTSCEDVVDIPVQTASTRLVIEASIDWVKGTTGNEQTIRLRTSTPFFDTTSDTAVTEASVMVTNDTNGVEFIFANNNNGTYTTSEFIPVLGQSYTLEVIYNGETYSANETLNSVPEITALYQDTEDGFDDETLEVHIVFTDPLEEENNYLFKFRKQGDLLPELEVGDDEFVNGNEIDWWYEIEEDDGTDELEAFVPGDIVNIELFGISDAYNNYMNLLIDQIGGVGFFEATPVAVKGNCINLTNSKNYAYGYFRLTEAVKTSYTFE